MGTEILVLLLLIMLNAFFAASEIALISLNDNKIKLMADEGHKKAIVLKNLLKEPSRFLATIQIGITLAGFLASAFASESFADPLVQLVLSTGVSIPENVLKTVAVFVVTMLLSYFTLVLGELVPKRIAMNKAEPIAMFVGGILSGLAAVTSPFVRLLTASTNFIVRLFGIDPNANDEEVTEEEIRMMVDVGEERGAIQETEKEMINNVFEFNNKVVSDIMTHRTEIVGMSLPTAMDNIAALFKNEQYSRIPVYEESIDNIVGILHVKDLVQVMLEGKGENFELRTILRKPYFVPVSKRIDTLFNDLKNNKTHMAVVIDEYGGTAGIITLEDLLEELVGNIFDEYDEEEKEYEKLDDNTYLIDGTVDPEKVEELLGVSLEAEGYETLSGYIIGLLGRIPETGEQPVIEDNLLVFKVEKIDDKRISKVKVCRA